ncbi:MAG: hypothetical protein WAX44_00345 [Minisyncoccia bacterium]
MSKKKLSAVERNIAIYKTLSGFLKNKKAAAQFSTPFELNEVESLFQTSIWGHREIILTIIMARLIDPKFKASENFYACNPRSIFEQPIRKALREYGIPHRKSGPLNVAKNSKKINRDWATDKHGGEIAMNVVKIVKKIESVSVGALEKFALAYIARYRQEAKRIKEMEVNLPPQENPIHISKLCIDLINFVPDGGATPQIIVGLLMETMNKDRKNTVIVSGHRDSVSTTNTTSKKPGDIIEKINDTSELIYEVTTKKFSDDRLIESHEAVMDYNKNLKDVFVICRPQDVPETLNNKGTSYIMATTQYQELAYYFINIYDYIQSAILFLTPQGRKFFYEELTVYVNNTNTAEKMKKYFKQWHSDNNSL